MWCKNYALALAAVLCGLLGLGSVRADGLPVCGDACPPSCGCDCSGVGGMSGLSKHGSYCHQEIEAVKKERRLYVSRCEEFCLPAVGLAKLFGKCCEKPKTRKYLVLKLHKYEVCCPRCKLVKPCECPCEVPTAQGPPVYLPPGATAPTQQPAPATPIPAPAPLPPATPIPAPTPLPKGTVNYTIIPTAPDAPPVR